MSEEITQPSESAPEAVPTLDDVISEFNIQPSQETMAPAEPKPVETQPLFNPVDPLDAEQWNRYQQQLASQNAELSGKLQELNGKLSQYDQERQQALVEADIKAAVKKVSESVEDSDPLMVELFLEKRARENEGFRSIWNNRQANPKALDAALKAISNELKGKFSIKADPQLAENQRAAQQSQQSNSTTQTQTFDNPIEEALASAQSEAEWQRAWEQAVRGG